ncbi:eisosome assembly protein Eis1 [Schizosaccharomyces osmophilus]|uniref:Eisosome assembly protein Eis1 n=1 Tax=Schizosaccharomyces osmophilus TaxID=2545709 RepID=A0AAE9WF99_9SCHI|nr:eisosome assembly protein Eis1 [Schizosaccharomyces osmophilus]WBW75341.1 eisosome assembly protein Eis1 [Schizosaccharomyces osmophilus]
MTSVNKTPSPAPEGAELTGLHSNNQQTATSIGNRSLKGHYGPHPHQDHPSAYLAAKTGFSSRAVPANLRYDQSNQHFRNGNDHSTVSNGPDSSRFQYVAAGANRATGHHSGAVENPTADSSTINTSVSYGYHPHPHAGKAAQSAHVLKPTDTSEGRPNENVHEYEQQRKPLQFPVGPVFAGSAQQPTGSEPHSSNEHDEDSSRKVRLASQLAKHSATFAHQAPEPQSAADSALPHRMAASQLVHNLSVQGSSSLEPQEASQETPSSANANSLAAASYAAAHARYDESSPTADQQKSPNDNDKYKRIRNMNFISASGDNVLRDHTGQEDNDDAFAGFSRSDLLNNAQGYQGSRASTSINTKNVGSERPTKPIYYTPSSAAINTQHQQKPEEGPSYDFSAASAALRRHRSMNANTSRNQTFESQEDARARALIRQMRLPTRSTISTNNLRREPSYSNNFERDQIQDEAVQRVRDMNLNLSKIQNRTDSQIRAYRPRSSQNLGNPYGATDQPHFSNRDADSKYTPHNQRRYSQVNQFSYVDGEFSSNDDGSYGVSPVETRAAAQQSSRGPLAATYSVPGRASIASNDGDVENLHKRLSRAYIDHEREETYAIDLGAGRLISPEELEAIARRNVDPMVSELAERAAQENQRKQQAIEAKAAKKQAKEEKKQRKRDEKMRKAEEKRLAKERAKFAKQMSKDAGKTDKVAPVPITDHEQDSTTSSEVSYDDQEQTDQSFDPAAQEYLIQQTDILNATKQQETYRGDREAEEDEYQPRGAELSGANDHNLGVPSHYLHDEEIGGALSEGEGNEVDGIERSRFPTVDGNGKSLQETNDTIPRASSPGRYADLDRYPVVQETVILPDGQERLIIPNNDESAGTNGYNLSEYKSDSPQKDEDDEDDLDENDKIFNKASPKSPVAWLRKKLKDQKDKAAVKRMLEEDSFKKQSDDERVYGNDLQGDGPPAANGFIKHEQRPQVVETHYEPGLVTEKTGEEVPDLVDAQPHVNISSIPRKNDNLGEVLDETYVSKVDAIPGGLEDFEPKKAKAVNGNGQLINHFPEPSKDPIGAAFHEDL